MSLSASLLRAGCGQRLDRQAGLPPGPPGPLPIQQAVYSQACPGGLPLPLRATSNSLSPFISLSLTLFPCFYLSAFLGFCVPTPPVSLSLPALALHLSSLCISLAVSHCFLSPSICLSLPPSLSLCLSLSSSFSSASRSSFLCPLLCLLLIPLALASLSSPRPLPLTPGSGHGNRVPRGDVEEEPLPSPAPYLLGGAAGLQCRAGPWGGSGPVETGWEVP